MREPESYDAWAHRERVRQEQWDNATGANRPPPPPPPFSVPSPGLNDPALWRGSSYEPSSTPATSPPDYGAAGAPMLALVTWPFLYPLAVALAFVVTGFVYGMLEVAFETAGSNARTAMAILGGLVGLIALYFTSRLDHRLGRSMLWRAPRHLIRLALLTVTAHAMLTTRLLAPAARGNGLEYGRTLLGKPWYVAILAGVALLAHVVLTRPRLRSWWHWRLGLDPV